MAISKLVSCSCKVACAIPVRRNVNLPSNTFLTRYVLPILRLPYKATNSGLLETSFLFRIVISCSLPIIIIFHFGHKCIKKFRYGQNETFKIGQMGYKKRGYGQNELTYT